MQVIKGFKKYTDRIRPNLAGNDPQGGEVHRTQEEHRASDSTHGISFKRHDVN